MGSTGLTYTITPQPLPANMTFNLETGQLTFAPAPGHAGTYDFSVAVDGAAGSGTVVVPVTVTNPALASTEVSGQVVDENGNPLAGMPVSIDGISVTTDQSGDFTLAGVSANPGPISAGGSAGSAQGRLDLMAPVAQLLNHSVYAGSNNVIPDPLILPEINWTPSAGFSQSSASQPLDITDPALASFDLHLAANASSSAFPASGTVSVAVLPASQSVQHMPVGVSAPMLLLKITGTNVPAASQLTLPNTVGFAPGTMLPLAALNPQTGGHDLVGEMVVSADGKTMTSLGPISLGSPSPATSSAPQAQTDATSSGSGGSSGNGGSGSPDTYQDCWYVTPQGPNSQQVTTCSGCQATATGTASPGNTSGAGSPPVAVTGNSQMDSDAGLLTGEYFLDHQLVTYQSQGQENGIDLQYSSAQAYPAPVVQYQFTTPPASGSAAIASITAQVNLAGVIQGPAVTYNDFSLQDGETFNVPLQVNASSLPTGVYPYTITAVEEYGPEFQDVTITSVDQGYVNVVNSASDPLGAGWSVGGLQHVWPSTSGAPVLITAGQQGTEQFAPVYTEGQTYIQDLGLATNPYSAQVLPNDGMGDFLGTTTAADSVVGTATGVFTSNGKPDMAVVTSSALAIQLDNGPGQFIHGNSYTFPSGYEAKAVAVGNFAGHGDSTLDIAVLLCSTSTGAYEIAEYTGNGSGGFAAPVISAVSTGVASGALPDTMAAANFTGSPATDLAFNTDDGNVDVMLPTSGGSFGAATALTLPAEHLAMGVATTGAYANGQVALIVEVKNDMVEEQNSPFVALDAFTANGFGGFTYTSTFQTPGQPDTATVGLVTGDFQGTAGGLEVAVPITNGGGDQAYLEIAPISSTGVWSTGTMQYIGAYVWLQATQPGNIVTADFNGAGKPSIALVNSETGQIDILSADLASNQFLPLETVTVNTSGSPIGMIAAAPFMGTAAAPGLPRADQRPLDAGAERRRHLDPHLSRRHRSPVQRLRPGDFAGGPQRQYLPVCVRHQRHWRRAPWPPSPTRWGWSPP